MLDCADRCFTVPYMLVRHTRDLAVTQIPNADWRWKLPFGDWLKVLSCGWVERAQIGCAGESQVARAGWTEGNMDTAVSAVRATSDFQASASLVRISR